MSQIKTISSSFSVNTLEDGKSAAPLEFNKPLLMYTALNSGTSNGAQSFVVSFALKVDGNACTISSTDDVVIVSKPSQVVVNRSYITTSSIQVNIPTNKTAATLEGSIVVRVTGTYGGETYTSTAAITVSANRVGATGGRGKVGRFFYFAGTFNPQDNDPTHVLVVNDAQAPYFEHTETITTQSGTTTVKRYHVFNYETNGSYTMAQMWSISKQSWNNTPWVAMTNDFKYLITEAIFSNFAHLGSAIISGDWKLSQYGKIYDTNSDEHIIDSTNTWNSGTHTYTKDDAYTLFDSEYPNSSKPSANNFVPNYAEDWLSGATYQQEAYISGEIHAQSLSTEFVDVNYSNDDTYYINLDEDGEVKDEKNWNYRFVPTDTGTTSLSIVLPVNKYFHFGQRVILYNPSLSLVDGQWAAQKYISVESFFIDEFGMTGTQRPILGISAIQPGGWTTPQNTQNPPQPMNSFKPVGKIWFTNGILELVCVPPYDGAQSDALCDWAMVNIGTNYYKVEEL